MRLRQQFEGVIWRFKTGGQWREMPREFGAWSTVHNRFRQWRDTGVFEALLEGLIAEAAKRGERPHRSAMRITGTSPPCAIRFGSSNAAETAAGVWETWSGSGDALLHPRPLRTGRAGFLAPRLKQAPWAPQ